MWVDQVKRTQLKSRLMISLAKSFNGRLSRPCANMDCAWEAQLTQLSFTRWPVLESTIHLPLVERGKDCERTNKDRNNKEIREKALAILVVGEMRWIEYEGCILLFIGFIKRRKRFFFSFYFIIRRSIWYCCSVWIFSILLQIILIRIHYKYLFSFNNYGMRNQTSEVQGWKISLWLILICFAVKIFYWGIFLLSAMIKIL